MKPLGFVMCNDPSLKQKKVKILLEILYYLVIIAKWIKSWAKKSKAEKIRTNYIIL